MRLVGTRLGMQSSLVWLVLWVLLQLGRATSEAAGRRDALALALAGTIPQFLLPAIGFAGVMIFGMAQHFVPLFTGRAAYSRRLVVAQVIVANAAVAAILLGAMGALPALQRFGFGLWVAAAVMFVGSIVQTIRTPVVARRPGETQPAFRGVDRRAIPLTVASAVYLLVSSVAFLLSSLPETNYSFGPNLFFPSALHLYALGFVTLMIFGVGLHLFPRFLGVPASPVAAGLILGLGIPAPLGVALFMNLPGPAFPLAAALEAFVAVVFVVTVGLTFLRSGKRRPAIRFVFASLGFLSLGIALGVVFAVDPPTRMYAPVHGWINLLGFVGFMIFGVLGEVVPAYAHKGYASAVRAGTAHLVLLVAGLAVHLAGVTLSIGRSALGDAVAVLGLLVLAPAVGSFVWGTISAMRHAVGSGPAPVPLEATR